MVCMERMGTWTQSTEERPVGLGVPLLIPCTCTAALTNSRALFSSATPNPPLSFQCVSNPSTSPKLHLTPIPQVIKLLYLGLSSIFFVVVFFLIITISEHGATEYLSREEFTAGSCKELANHCASVLKESQSQTGTGNSSPWQEKNQSSFNTLIYLFSKENECCYCG